MNKISMINLDIKLKEINGIPRRCYYIDYVEYDAEKLVESFKDKKAVVETLKSKKLNEGKESVKLG